jgi:hypothetical protein
LSGVVRNLKLLWEFDLGLCGLGLLIFWIGVVNIEVMWILWVVMNLSILCGIVIHVICVIGVIGRDD